jgi:hypothetical protein
MVQLNQTQTTQVQRVTIQARAEAIHQSQKSKSHLEIQGQTNDGRKPISAF